MAGAVGVALWSIDVFTGVQLPQRPKQRHYCSGQPSKANSLTLELVEEELIEYEYAVYVTALKEPAGEIRALYNPRGDNENSYDELKNQWGWCGFTLRDLARSELMARLIALIYNWWSLYTKLVDEQIAREAMPGKNADQTGGAGLVTHRSNTRAPAPPSLS